MNISIPYFFQMIDEASSRQDKKNILLTQHNNIIKDILRYTYSSSITFLLPEGRPPYTAMPDGQDNTKLLYGQLRKFYLFTAVDGVPQSNISSLQRELKFIEVLESVTPQEAEIVMQMKERKIKAKGLTQKLIREIFPELL